MAIEFKKEGTALWITLSDEIGHDGAEELRALSAEHIKEDIGRVKIVLKDLYYITSTGLGVLVGIRLMAKKANAKVTLVSPSEEAMQILKLNSLDVVFEIEELD